MSRRRNSNAIKLVGLLALSTVHAPAHAFLESIFGTPNCEQPSSAKGQKPAAPAAPAAGTPTSLSALFGSANADCAPPGAAPAPGSPVKPTRTPGDLNRLFSAGDVSGSELLAEIKAIRNAAASQNINTAMGTLYQTIDTQGLKALANGNNKKFLGGLFSRATDSFLDMLTAEMSYTVLNRFFNELADRKDVLDAVRISLPKSDKLTASQKQQVLNLAGFLAAIKASNAIVSESNNDFEKADQSFRKVLERRQQAARLLGEIQFTKAGLGASEQEGKRRELVLLSDADAAFLEQFRDRKPEDLMRDFNAQNIALDYLRRRDPKAFEDYKAEADQFRNHYSAYLRATVGAGSMAGFSALFFKRIKTMVEQQGQDGAATILPLALDGAGQALELATNLKKVGARGFSIFDAGGFILEKDGKPLKEDSEAGKVFTTLDPETLKSFRGDLIRNDGKGYLYKLYQRDASSAGRILDATTSKDQKKQFVAAYYGSDDLGDFTFTNEVTKPAGKRTKSKLGNQLLGQEMRDDGEDDEKALAGVQNALRNNLSDWKNDHLRMLIFSNYTGAPSNARLQVGDYTIRMLPTMEAVFDYESFVAHAAEHATLRRQDDAEPRPANGRKNGKKRST